MDKSHMILTQLPIVLSLILLFYQSWKTFGIKEFKFIYYGFTFNLIYLLSSFLFAYLDIDESSLLGNTRISSLVFYSSIIDMAGMIFFLSAIIISYKNRNIKSYYVLLFYLALIIASVIRIIPDNPLKDIVPFIHMRNILYSVSTFLILVTLASTLYKITKGYKGGGALFWGMISWALIQFFGIAEFDTFKEYFGDDRIEAIAFGLGFISKSIILYGLFKFALDIGEKNANNKEIASKLDLIFGVSFHEFTHPLRGLKKVLQEINPANDKKAPSYIGAYSDAAKQIDEYYNHLLAIISASLKMYVAGTGKLVNNDFYKSVTSNSVVTESINTTIQLVVLNQKSLIKSEEAEKIKFEYNMGGNCIVKYNHIQVYQVFQNLFKNSIEAFNGNEGIINIKTRVIKPEKLDDVKEVGIEISDNGPGIDTLMVDRIFDYGYSTKGLTGRGLGLAIAREIVIANSGKLELVIPKNIDTPRIPAHFKITFPKAKTIL